jgi:hypothetical protein
LETAAMSAFAPSGMFSSAAAASAAAFLCQSISFSASSSACSVLASWAFSSVGEDMVAWEGVGWILKKNVSNQSTTERVGAKEVPIVYYIRNR